MNRLIDKAPSGASRNWKGMLGLSLAIALGSGLLLFALYQAQGASVAQAQSNTRITAEITAEEYDRNDDWSGFYDRRYGSVSPDNFNYQGINFEYKQIRYDDDDNELQIKFSKCIDLGEFVSLKLDPDEGSAVTVYKRDVIYLSVAETACPSSRSSTQRFDFNVSRNPLPDGAEVDMTLVLTADASPGAPTATATPVPTPAPVCDILPLSPLNSTLNRTGAWTSGCPSTYRSGRNARYYKLQVQEREEIRITLSGSVDPWLVVRRGNSKTGTILHQNNDGGGTLGQTSRVTETLAVGFYTLELTTVARNVTGTYNLLIEVVEPTPTPTPLPTQPTPVPTPPIASCSLTAFNLSATGHPTTKSGRWSSTCQSSKRTGKYAKFYDLRLPRTTTVEINLLSSVDSYINLLSGTGTDGTILTSDDNSGLSTNARLTVQLAAGNYTIEATPSKFNSSSDFHLRIREPKVTVFNTTHAHDSDQYAPINTIFPRIIVDHFVRHDWVSESFGRSQYKSFVGHTNSVILQNIEELTRMKGRVQGKSAISHVYPNNAWQFSIYTNAWSSTGGIYPGDTDWWGGSHRPEYGRASTEYLYRADRPTHSTNHWSFWFCRNGGCYEGYADFQRLNLWGGTN